MRLYSQIAERVLLDIADHHNIDHAELVNWRTYVRQAYRLHGRSYWTVVLPSLGKRLDYVLAGSNRHRKMLDLRDKQIQLDSDIEPDRFLEYDESIPPSLYSRVFTHSGYLRHDADVTVVSSLRQWLYMMYKLEFPYTPDDEKKIIEGFIETDRSVGRFNRRSDSILRLACLYTKQVFGSIDPREIQPSHGPGAVATGEKPHEKGEFKRIYSSLNKVYPFDEYFMYSLSHVCDELSWLQSREVLSAGTAKVVLVPKDSRGPRLISCEPLEYQWIQQGLARVMMSRLEHHPLTAGFVNFTDQSVNQWLSLIGSTDSSSVSSLRYVTLDMKDASDRVGLSLVEEIFAGTRLLEGLIASRTPETRLPDGRVHKMRKFAPMGSALCFPVESWVFYILALVVISVHRRLPITDVIGSVYVYGDDIICKAEDYRLLLHYLPKYGLMFNLGKCCTGGLFRESCGMDAFRGVDVTPVKFRTLWSRRPTVNTLVSWTEYSNSLWTRGYRITAEYIRKLIESQYGPIPFKHRECDAYVGFVCDLPSASIVKHNRSLRFRYRFNACYQRREIRVLVPQTKSIVGQVSSSWLEILRRTSKPQDHDIGRYSVRRRVYLQRRWSPAA
jgi:hypothetical protein